MTLGLTLRFWWWRLTRRTTSAERLIKDLGGVDLPGPHGWFVYVLRNSAGTVIYVGGS